MSITTTNSIYDITVTRIDGTEESMSLYRGKVLLIVNVASRCVLTAQYEPLQALYDKYKDRGFVVLGFPCNQFGQQERGSNSEIQEFCSLRYNVSFPMFAKVDVNGPNTHPLYAYLKRRARGNLGISMIKWNFAKFLVSRDGERIQRYWPMATPASLESAIESALAQPVPE